MRYTEYHNGVAVIKDKALLKDAMAKLAKYEDAEVDLEKQIPKKPVEIIPVIGNGKGYECKNCGGDIESVDMIADYCKWCGQRLDWSE